MYNADHRVFVVSNGTKHKKHADYFVENDVHAIIVAECFFVFCLFRCVWFESGA